MDNEPSCTTCKFWKRFNWKQFRYSKGLCDMVDAPYEETVYDFSCNHWEEADESD